MKWQMLLIPPRLRSYKQFTNLQTKGGEKEDFEQIDRALFHLVKISLAEQQQRRHLEFRFIILISRTSKTTPG